MNRWGAWPSSRRVWEWRKQYGNTIVDQYKRLGASADYADERFTLDEGYAGAVAKVFVDLYDQGLIYRDNYMVNWDPGSRSAITTSRSKSARCRTPCTTSPTQSRAAARSSSPPSARRRCWLTSRSR